MSVKKLFYYWFYKYYSFLERYDQTRWMPHTKAMIIVNTLLILFLETIIIYFEIATFKSSRNIDQSMAIFKILVLITLFITIPALGGDNWKKHVNEFDEWDSVNKNKGAWIVLVVTITILLNFFISISLWRQMQGWPV